MIAIIIYGPPGSGKGTQAQLLAEKFDLIHLDSGRYLREILYNPKFKKNKIIQRERKINEAGKLNTPSWVLKIISERVEKIGKLNKGIVFSGSPRTLYETVSIQKRKGIIELLEKIYKKKNIFIFKINISEKQTVKRNSNRLVCSICRNPVLGQKSIIGCKLSRCSLCGAKLEHRFDDKKEVISTRLKEYRERTLPIIQFLKKRGYKIAEIDGSPLPYKIYNNILTKLK